MASIINSISFKNFFNYYGDYDDNNYELEEGINIIVADNGAGKSKFFNAFLWLFNNQILDSDDKIPKNIKDIFVKIVSDKAKNEASIRDYVECGIQIEYTFGTRYKYQIRKSFLATKLNDNITDPNSWQFVPNDVEVNRTELILHKYKPIDDVDKKRQIIENLIMPNFRKYSFLQGEEVDQIIDFSKKSSIEEAVQNLTDIKKYEKLVELTEYIKYRAEKDLNSQNKVSNDQSRRLKDAINEKSNIQKILENEKIKLTEYENLYNDAELEKNELDKTYANAEKRKDLDDILKIENKKVRIAESEYEDFLERINNRFFDGNFSWISMGLNAVVSDFKKLNDNFTEERYKQKALQDVEENPNNYFHFLPVDSPDLISLQQMLDNEHCYVCDRPAKEHTREYEYLKKLRDRPKGEIKKKSFVKNDLKDFFGSLQINAQPFYDKIDDVKDSVNRTRKKEDDLRDRLKKLISKVKSLKDQRKDILVAGNDDENNAASIISRYQGSSKRMENARVRIDDNLKPRIKKLNLDIKNLEVEIESLSNLQDIPQGYIDNYSISKDLAQATIKAKERVYNDMISLLENHANSHFKNLIANNDLAGGILKFEKSPSGSINFNYIDSKNNIVHGSSEGFQRMKKFSVVMAIISANSSNYNYPLLADAPISAFGEGFTEGFFEATGKVFPQSIILVKELYKKEDPMKINELGKRLLKEKNVKTMYVNQVSEGAEQIDLITTKIKLK
jgi:DNA sulfur modification protein DndD